MRAKCKHRDSVGACTATTLPSSLHIVCKRWCWRTHWIVYVQNWHAQSSCCCGCVDGPVVVCWIEYFEVSQMYNAFHPGMECGWILGHNFWLHTLNEPDCLPVCFLLAHVPSCTRNGNVKLNLTKAEQIIFYCGTHSLWVLVPLILILKWWELDVVYNMLSYLIHRHSNTKCGRGGWLG